MRLCILVAYGKDNVDKATIGLTFANAALEAKHKVDLVLASEGVRLAVKGYVDDMNNGEPFKPVKQLLEGALQKGVELHVCMPCVQKRKIDEKSLSEPIHKITGPDVIQILVESDRSIQL